MCFGSPPFHTAGGKDLYFKCITKKRFDVFWKAHTKHRAGGDNFSSEYKDLVEKMLAADPEDRITL